MKNTSNIQSNGILPQDTPAGIATGDSTTCEHPITEDRKPILPDTVLPGTVLPDTVFIRLDKIKGTDGIIKALKHNKRTLPLNTPASAHIDSSRVPLNYSLTGDDTPADINQRAKDHMRSMDKKLRKNQVMAVEIIFSLPIQKHRESTRAFFEDCKTWVKENIAGILLSFDIHLDESAPHAHALILPLVDGRMNGNKIVGNAQNLGRLRKHFYEFVGKKHGLEYHNSYKQGDRKIVEKSVFDAIEGDPVRTSVLWPCIRDAIRKNPYPYSGLLNHPWKQGNMV